MRKAVVLPAPLGPIRPVTRPSPRGQRQAVHRANLAERFFKITYFDHRFRPDRTGLSENQSVQLIYISKAPIAAQSRIVSQEVV